jgi:hypothetical protein
MICIYVIIQNRGRKRYVKLIEQYISEYMKEKLRRLTLLDLRLREGEVAGKV